MIAPTFLLPNRAAMYRDEGWWQNESLDSRFRQSVRPNVLALVDGYMRLSYDELDRHADAVAAALEKRGVGRGQAVAFLLPNWWEAAVVHLATARLGAVTNPLHTIYRQRELRFVLGESRAPVVFAAGSHRGRSYADFVRDIAPDVDHDLEVVEVRGDGGFEAILEDGGRPHTSGPRPDDVLLLMYTSGTTADPKGVLHSHETMLRAGDDLVDLFDLGPQDVMFVPSPMTHITGLLYVQIALSLGITSVLLDRWDPVTAMDRVRAEGCTFVGGATPFINGLVQQARRLGLGPDDIPLSRGSCGGADVPMSLVAEAQEVLGARFSRVYGLTEGVTATGCRVGDGLSRRGGTDGHPLRGMELKICRPTGEPAPPGEIGEILIRGPANFLGYLDPSQNAATVTGDGWIRTGDLGSTDEHGDLHVRGRLKDIIIRGGENIPVREVEDLLLEHPAIEQVAIVGMPDAHLGERACAFVKPRAGATVNLSLDGLVDFLKQKQIAPQKLPERLEVLADGLPTTPSGKIQKYKLRERVLADEMRVER